MKVILFIFSIYFLGLNIMPCNDGNMEQHDEVEQTVDIDDHDNHDHEDECSPFCQCNCCSVHVISFEFEPLEFIVLPVINSQISFYISPVYDGFDGSILQPPQLNS
ncbi:DUF6660 family protein [Nonlabens sp. Asnod3-H03]|uniref:DUF6660 family protein n=1 Tax=Nonlabens sp. Asnod3-H03 TaxID=3160580 RepID=UPI00386B3596